MKLKRTYKSVVIAVVYLVVIFFAAQWRAQYMARLLGGDYSRLQLLFDVAAFAIVIGLMHLLNFSLKYGFRKLIGAKRFSQKVIVFGIQFVLMTTIAGSFIFTLLQLHPQRVTCVKNPRSMGMNYSEVMLSSDGNNLSAWYIPADEAKASGAPSVTPIVLVAHGLGANKQNFLSPCVLMHELGYNVFIFDFRAHGNSQGNLMTFGYDEAHDVMAAYEWLKAHHPGHQIYALGYSLGGAAVLRAAAEYNIFSRIIVDSTFAELETVATQHIGYVLGWELCRFWAWVWTGVDMDDNQPVRFIADPALAGRSILIIAGKADTMIPCSESVELSKANPNAKLWLIEGKGHIEGITVPEYQQRLSDFLEDRE